MVVGADVVLIVGVDADADEAGGGDRCLDGAHGRAGSLACFVCFPAFVRSRVSLYIPEKYRLF